MRRRISRTTPVASALRPLLPVKLCDPRSPPVPRTGIGIVWSSRPAPATDVEFRLRFSGVPGARYRAYLSDSRGLELALFEGERPRTRAEIAVDGAQKGLAGVGLRERFRLLTDEPLKPAADGRVLFDTRLPRALETVQFLRFVPLQRPGRRSAVRELPAAAHRGAQQPPATGAAGRDAGRPDHRHRQRHRARGGARPGRVAGRRAGPVRRPRRPRSRRRRCPDVPLAPGQRWRARCALCARDRPRRVAARR